MPTDTPNNVGASVPLTAKDQSKTSKNGTVTGANNQWKIFIGVFWFRVIWWSLAATDLGSAGPRPS